MDNTLLCSRVDEDATIGLNEGIYAEEAEEMKTVQDMVDTLIRKCQQGECRIGDGERPLRFCIRGIGNRICGGDG